MTAALASVVKGGALDQLKSVEPPPTETRDWLDGFAIWGTTDSRPIDRPDAERQRRILEVYDALSASLHAYLRNMGLSVEEAEDTIQETFLRLARHLKSGGDDDNLRSWVFQVAHNLTMDIHRANRHARSILDPYGEMVHEPADPRIDPERMYLKKELAASLTAAMSRLTRVQRTSILLRAEGMRYLEIALLLGVSEQRVIYVVKHGRMRLAGGLRFLRLIK